MDAGSKRRTSDDFYNGGDLSMYMDFAVSNIFTRGQIGRVYFVGRFFSSHLISNSHFQ